jgi:hypothetical protein
MNVTKLKSSIKEFNNRLGEAEERKNKSSKDRPSSSIAIAR